SVEICLNLQGSGRLQAGARAVTLGVRTIALYAHTRASRLAATRAANERHHFVTVEMSRGFLARHVGAVGEYLQPDVNAFLSATGDDAPIFATVQPMPVAVQNLAHALIEPPIQSLSPVQALWYQAKVLELAALLLFAPGPAAGGSTAELFCERQKRLGRERVERVRALLERDLENPPTLEQLAREAGCGVFHLSRSFSQQLGLTIPQYLRQVRMARAAQLLREGRHNVTETAVAVGYSSLSHFSKAFWETHGCCPGLYSNAKLANSMTRLKLSPSPRGKAR
ncbi:MAG: helix-turn-helix transcriptional regulator, partial [Verrucomicrobia bacterium]|nr:helix-turn-helix transcriptional regulator [Verrucomicrobiota bacterium]